MIKLYGVDFTSDGGALTLPVDAVTTDDVDSGTHTRRHDSGWIITGAVQEDYFRWVNSFSAYHPTYGIVAGDFEDEIYASSEEAFSHFYKNHPPDEWDYNDI